jgi:uncharacterized protein YbaP (TraB family)
VLAAQAMLGDIEKRDRWNQMGVMSQLLPMTRKLHVKIRFLAGYSAMDFLRSLAKTPEAGTQACLAYVADSALATDRGLTQPIDAWAKGDFAAVRTLNGRWGKCLDAVPAVAALRDRAAADWAKELKAELGRPGKAVVIVDLDTLTRKGGLLDQLKAEGLEVIGPDY